MNDEYSETARVLSAGYVAFWDCVERSRKKNPKAWNFKWHNMWDCVRDDSISIASLSELQRVREMRKELFK